jgi:hypothetical protein
MYSILQFDSLTGAAQLMAAVFAVVTLVMQVMFFGRA